MAATKKTKKTAAKKTYRAPAVKTTNLVSKAEFDKLLIRVDTLEASLLAQVESIGELTKQVLVLNALKDGELTTPLDAHKTDEVGKKLETSESLVEVTIPVSTEPASAQTVETTPVSNTAELKPVPATEPISF